ncbi:hypothetical protein [Mycoplasmopsis columboralis]|uniref:Uncharacterized protein n=1 Tax=Mycoplasmopsis columboralis TaxID=171282 RepID=A0A449B7L9_9BACT|nr:hypothetical protein [Mycoplasmopsis columboralis]VEU76578.1 Uncharacterised protein [Mycoplasmopsis columboralis]
MYNLEQLKKQTKWAKTWGMEVALFPLMLILFGILIAIGGAISGEFVIFATIVLVLVGIYYFVSLIMATVYAFKLRRLAEFVRMKHPNETGFYNPSAAGTLFIVGWVLTLFLLGGLILWIGGIVLAVKANEFNRILDTINFNETTKAQASKTEEATVVENK